MKLIFILTLSFFSITVLAESHENGNVYYIKSLPRQENPHQPSTRVEYLSFEYYQQITPRIFLKRVPDRPLAWYMTRAPQVTEMEAREVFQYMQRDDLYKHDFKTLEAYLKNKFQEKLQVNHQNTYTSAFYQIELNLKYGYQILKNYDLIAETDFAERAQIEYLGRVFQQHRGTLVTPDNDEILKDFIKRLDSEKAQASYIEDSLRISQMAIEYYQVRKDFIGKNESKGINKAIHQIARAAHELASAENLPFYQKFFHNAYQKQLNQPSQDELITSENKSPNVAKNPNIEDFKVSVFNLANDVASGSTEVIPLTYKDTKITIEATKHFLTESHGNITYLPSHGDKRTIYRVKVLTPGIHTNEAVLHAVQMLLERNVEIYGVYFENKIQIPSKLDLGKYEVSTIGQSRILIRNVKDTSLACPVLFQ